MLVFGFVELLLQISMNRAKFVGEKYDLESSQVKRVAKQAQQAQSKQNLKPIPWSKVAQNAAFEKCWDCAKQRAPRVARGEGRTAVRPLVRFISSFSAQLFDFLRVYEYSTALLTLKWG